MKKVLLISFLILLFKTASAGISTKKQEILKLIGTSIDPNGNIAWIVFNGKEFVWTRVIERIDNYVYVIVKMV